MRNLSMTFTAGSVDLAGTLCLGADGPSPAALLISGSGPLDRDSNAKKLSIDLMAQVADRLAVEGVASFRYDKRGVGQSGGEYHSAGLHDNIDDATAALAALRARPEVDADRVVVIGHSEGAIIATELAAAEPELAGVALLAGPATPGRQLLEWQGERVSETLPRPVTALLRLLRTDLTRTQTKRLDQLEATTDDTVRMQLVKINAKWFREFLAHDPARSLRRITVPVLALTGSKDIQVDPADAEQVCLLVGGPCRHQVLPGLTHLLRSELGSPSLRTYKKQAKRPVDAVLLDSLAVWSAAPLGSTGGVDLAAPSGDRVC